MKKLLKLIGKYKIFLGFSVIFAAISVVLQLYVPVLFGDAIDEVVAAHQVNFDMMWYYLRQILVFIVISALATWFMNLLNNRMTYRIVQDIRSQAIRHIQVLPLSYLDQHSTGDIVSRVIADTDILSDGLLLGFTQLFSGIVTIVVTLIFMFSKNVWVTLLVIVLTPFSFVVAKFISSRSYTMFRKQSETRGRQTALIEEMIGGQKVVKAFGYEKESSRRFDEINKELQTYSQKAVFYSSLTNPSTRFVNNIIYAGVALLGAFLIPGGTLTVGGLSVLLSYANQYMKPFNDISSVITEMQNALACADRIFDLLEQKEETADAEGVFATVYGNVTIDDVAFSYDKEKELIQQIITVCKDEGKEEYIPEYESRLKSVEYYINKQNEKGELDKAYSLQKEGKYKEALDLYLFYFNKDKFVLNLTDRIIQCYRKLNDKSNETRMLEYALKNKLSESNKLKYEKRLEKLKQEQ